MNKAREYFNKHTKGMTLEEKLKWVQSILFYIEIDNYIKDKEEWREYLKIKDELLKELSNTK